MPWAAVADCETLMRRIGVVVTDDDIDTAQDIVEIYSDVTEDQTADGLIGGRDLRLLNRAVKYQAIYVAAHPEIFTGQDVAQAAADGVAATYAHLDARLLAPLAHRTIRRLSWKVAGIRVGHGRQSTEIGPAQAAVLELTGDRDSAERDDHVPWWPLGPGGHVPAGAR